MRQLVSVYRHSSVRCEVAIGNGALEETGFVILQEMIGQTLLRFPHLGTLATVPTGQVSMLLTNMGSE